MEKMVGGSYGVDTLYLIVENEYLRWRRQTLEVWKVVLEFYSEKLELCDC